MGLVRLGPPQPLVLTNTSSSVIGPVSVATQDPGQFPIATNECSGKTLAPGTSCTITVFFQPTSASTQASNLTVSAPDMPQLSIPMTGHGVNQVSAIQIAPTFYDFGTLEITGLGAVIPFTVRNTGNMPTVVNKVSIEPTGPPYDLTDDGCIGTRIAPAEQCTFSVQFKPTTPGNYINALNVGTTTGAGVSISIKGAGR